MKKLFNRLFGHTGGVELVENLRADNREFARQIHQVRGFLVERDARIAELESNARADAELLKGRSNMIADLRQTLDSAQAEIDRLNDKLRAKGTQVVVPDRWSENRLLANGWTTKDVQGIGERWFPPGVHGGVGCSLGHAVKHLDVENARRAELSAAGWTKMTKEHPNGETEEFWCNPDRSKVLSLWETFGMLKDPDAAEMRKVVTDAGWKLAPGFKRDLWVWPGKGGSTFTLRDAYARTIALSVT